jgi:hypothetical protein
MNHLRANPPVFTPLGRIRPRPLEVDRIGEIEDMLAPYFHWEHEVVGEHWTGRRLRMDGLLHPDGWTWGDGSSLPIGIEVKRDGTSVGAVTRSIGQAVDYVNSRWRSALYPGEELRVMVAVPVFDVDMEGDDYHEAGRVYIDRMVGRLNVAMLHRERDGLVIRVSGSKIWSERRGPIGNMKMTPKVGAR